MRLRLDDYRRVRSNARWFLVAHGHEEAGGAVEIVQTRPGFLIVEKQGVACEVAEEPASEVAMSDERMRRVARNEAVFRGLNEQLGTVQRGLAAITGGVAAVCECGDLSCVEQLVVPVDRYEAVRADSALFIVAPGHELPDVEDVVERTDRFYVVRKHPGAGERVAALTDQRA